MVEAQCSVPDVRAFHMVQEAIGRKRRAVGKVEQNPLGVRVATPEKGCEATDRVVFDWLDQRASIRADLLPEDICLGLVGNPLNARTHLRFCQRRRVRSIDFQVRDPVRGRSVSVAGSNLQAPPARLRREELQRVSLQTFGRKRATETSVGAVNRENHILALAFQHQLDDLIGLQIEREQVGGAGRQVAVKGLLRFELDGRLRLCKCDRGENSGNGDRQRAGAHGDSPRMNRDFSYSIRRRQRSVAVPAPAPLPDLTASSGRERIRGVEVWAGLDSG